MTSGIAEMMLSRASIASSSLDEGVPDFSFLNQALTPADRIFVTKSVSLGQEKYPDDAAVAAALERRTKRIYFVEGSERARLLGNPRTLNIFMLGCLSVFAPLDIATWKEYISRRLPEKIRQVNLTAFEMGRKEIEGVGIGES